MKAIAFILICISPCSYAHQLIEKYEIYQDKDTEYYGIKKNNVVVIPAQFQLIFPSEKDLQEDTLIPIIYNSSGDALEALDSYLKM